MSVSIDMKGWLFVGMYLANKKGTGRDKQPESEEMASRNREEAAHLCGIRLYAAFVSFIILLRHKYWK